MSGAALSRRVAQVEFHPDTVPEPERSWSATCVVDHDTLTIKATFEDEPFTWRFAGYPRRSLALEMFDLFPWMFQSGRYFQSFASTVQYRLKMGGFLSKIEKLDPSGRVRSLRDIDRAFLDTLDGPQLPMTAWNLLQKIVKTLKAARARNRASVSSDLRDEELGDRLKFVSSYSKPPSTPKDPYSPFVEAQIVQAAKSEIATCIERVRAGLAALDELRKRPPSSPAEEITVKLIQKAHVSAKEWDDVLASAQVSRQTPREYVDLRQFDHEQVSLAAELVTQRMSYENVERRLGWKRKTVSRLINYSPEFLLAIRRTEEEFLESVRQKIIEQQQYDDETVRLSRLALLKMKTEDIDDELSLELFRRLRVLKVWGDRDIPRSKLGTVGLTWSGVIGWTDPEYGFAPLGPARSIGDRRSALQSKIVAALKVLTDKHGTSFVSHNYPAYLRKITLLEQWLVTKAACSGVGPLDFNQAFFIRWTDECLGLEPLPYVQSAYAPRRYRALTQWGTMLLRALEVQWRHQGQILDRAPQPLIEIAPPAEMARRLSPTSGDLTALLSRLGLLVQIDIGSLKGLRRDCLQNAANGFVDVIYRKRRNSNKLYAERVRDGSLETPGGLIRVILELTEIASLALKNRKSKHADRLWLAAEGNGFKFCRFGGGHPGNPWSRICVRHEFLNEDGTRIDRLLPSRFRKTVKANKYRKANGDIFAIADDHSFAVSRDHYANVPSLASVHDDTVERGLRHAARQVTERVVDDAKSIASEARRLAAATGVVEQTCRDVIAGKEDTWLAGCLGFHSSPYGAEGDACPVSFTECLHCKNGVFTVRKLPNLLRYLAILEERRVTVSTAEWSALYQDDYVRLSEQILPRFAPAQIERAQEAIASDSDDTPLFIPSVLRRSI